MITAKRAMAELAMLTALTLLIPACGQKHDASDRDTIEIDTTEVISVDSLMMAPERYVGKRVTVTGRLSAHSIKDMRRMYLEGAADTVFIRVDATPALGGGFNENCPGLPVRVVGLMQEMRIDENYLLQLEKQRRLSTPETDEALALEDLSGSSLGQYSFTDTLTDDSESGFSASIAACRRLIAQRKATEGKDYLSGYYIDATSCGYIH